MSFGMPRRIALCVLSPFLIAAASGAVAQETAVSPGLGGETWLWLETGLHWTTRAIEIAGIATIVLGAVLATGIYLVQAASGGSQADHYTRFRSMLGRSILLGLEFLVAADIISTVAIDPTLESLAVLAGIVVIRTFLSFTLEVEIDGKWPWQSRRD